MMMMSEQAGKLLFSFKKQKYLTESFQQKKGLYQIWHKGIVTDSTGYSKKFLTPYNGVRALCQSERLNFLEKVDYNIFLHSRCLI